MRPLLPIGQMYHVAVDNQVPYYVYSNMQDDGTMRGPVTTPERLPGGYDTGNMWQHYLGGCESGFTIPDVTDPNIVWATCYGNKVTRCDARSGVARSVQPVIASRSTRRPTTRSTAATGRRRSRSIRSITTASTTAAR